MARSLFVRLNNAGCLRRRRVALRAARPYVHRMTFAPQSRASVLRRFRRVFGVLPGFEPAGERRGAIAVFRQERPASALVFSLEQVQYVTTSDLAGICSNSTTSRSGSIRTAFLALTSLRSYEPRRTSTAYTSSRRGESCCSKLGASRPKTSTNEFSTVMTSSVRDVFPSPVGGTRQQF